MVLRTARLAVLFAAAGLALVLAGCGARWERSLSDARRFAADRGFTQVRFDAGDYLITGFHSQGRGDDLVVYIQGDGRPYLSRSTVSSNPTPDFPVALALAVQDPAPNVLYLGRPCQFTGPEQPDSWRECAPVDWTLGRYGPQMVSAMNRALDQAIRRFGARRLHLVGHSGGGAMAALLAASRNDVASLITVAADLDHQAWTRHHGVTPLAGSLNPVDAAPALRAIPQIHFRGEQDAIVPPSTTAAFFHALENAPCLQIVDVPDMGHGRDWIGPWRTLLGHRSALACFPDPARIRIFPE